MIRNLIVSFLFAASAATAGVSITRYYDNSDASVVHTTDDAYKWDTGDFLETRWTRFLEMADLHEDNGMVLSIGLITSRMNDADAWTALQTEINTRGHYFQVGNHSWNHPSHFDEPEDYQQEYIDSRDDLYDNLTFLPQYRYKGSDYLLAFYQFGGVTNGFDRDDYSERFPILSTNNYLVIRSEKTKLLTDMPEWGASNGLGMYDTWWFNSSESHVYEYTMASSGSTFAIEDYETAVTGLTSSAVGTLKDIVGSNLYIEKTSSTEFVSGETVENAAHSATIDSIGPGRYQQEFDSALASNHTYFVYTHAWSPKGDVNGYNGEILTNFCAYVGNHTNVWYTNPSAAVSYKYLREEATPTIQEVVGDTFVNVTVYADSAERLKYGLSYPLTYQIDKPSWLSPTDPYQVHVSDPDNPGWSAMTKKTDSDLFTGIDCYRDGSNVVYVSKGFPENSDHFSVRIRKHRMIPAFGLGSP